MQPRAEPTLAKRPQVARGDEEDLYRRHHRDLQRAVTHVVHAPRELIEDACQTAWALFLRTRPDRYAVFAWLRVVAIHEAYRLSAIERRDARLERLRPEDGTGTMGWPIPGRSTTLSRHSRRCVRSPRCPTASAPTSH